MFNHQNIKGIILTAVITGFLVSGSVYFYFYQKISNLTAVNSNLTENNCNFSGGVFKNNSCHCGDLHYLEQSGYCVDDEGVQGGEYGRLIRDSFELMINQKQ